MVRNYHFIFLNMCESPPKYLSAQLYELIVVLFEMLSAKCDRTLIIYHAFRIKSIVIAQFIIVRRTQQFNIDIRLVACNF